MNREQAMMEGERRVALERLNALYRFDTQLSSLIHEAKCLKLGRTLIRRLERAREVDLTPKIEKTRALTAPERFTTK